ncbi:MAG: efflux RND transporter periplasmic adaptor subunit [Bacteroidales bacterium]|nr:efflux RND transporter periplasmic adaptor subunit [Bacteroidales bacterium]
MSTINSRIVFLFALLVLFFTFSCQQQTGQPKENKTDKTHNIPRKVSVTILEKDDFAEQIISNGMLRPSVSAELFFKQAGIINKINFRNGQTANKGAVVAALNNARQLLELRKAEESLKETETELSSLLIGFGGKEGDTASVNNKLLQNLKSQSGYSRALLNLQSAKMDYENTWLKAPFSGIVSGIEKQNYNQILPSEPFCTLLNDNNFIADFTVIEQELAQIRIGQKVKVYPIAYDTVFVTGGITEINPSVDENGLIKIKALLDNPGGKRESNFMLLAGMNIKVIIEEIKPNQLFIPKSALVLRSGKQVVFTFSAGLAKWNYVITGAENSDSYLIAEGLSEGDTLITEGNLNLAHDAVVEIKSNQ